MLCHACKFSNLTDAIKNRQAYLYGVTGLAGSGKTTFAKYIIDQTKTGTIIPFAAKVKEFAKLLGWDGEKDAKGRRLLQLIGTECGRECIDPDLWVMAWHESVKYNVIRQTPIIFIADDIRFDNEAEAILALGGTVIKITGRNSGVGTEHASESGISDNLIHRRINNTHSISELRKEAAKYANIT